MICISFDNKSPRLRRATFAPFAVFLAGGSTWAVGTLKGAKASHREVIHRQSTLNADAGILSITEAFNPGCDKPEGLNQHLRRAH